MTPYDIHKLQEVLPLLPASSQGFAVDLIRAHKKYGKLTPKQAPWVEKLIVRATTPKPEAPKVDVGDFSGVISLFHVAKAHLKYPKIRLMAGETTIILSLATQASKQPGTVNIVGEGSYPDRAWYGRITPAGVWEPSLKMTPEFQASLQDLLTKLAKNPARVAQQYGKLTGNCCFCGAHLEDKRSTAVGFGPICAEHYGLKAQWKAAADIFDATEAVVAETPLTPVQTYTDMVAEFPLAQAPEVVVDSVPDGAICTLCDVNPGVKMVTGLPVCAACAQEVGM